ncbi:alpha-latroinsectotoxin-Lt1a [Culex quinquefasciatus]|uniref:alpha-latroinsectotoxin-Lt1a n=1 Tax=Culex quinquefasciatus TaxID=7176 RepID=UPI0018E385A7|nr:alpha-latroinsectotoxin-Lt1a [Culex quinquefasciatus]
MLAANGADVNYVNDKGKTPLQEAEATGNRKMVELLLERGANSDERKLSRQMPIVRRKERSFREIHEMMESTKPNVKRHPVPNSVGETYTKRSGTAAVGELFEKKLLTMVLFRLLHDDQIESFYLGTNVDETGAFDDVVLRTSFGGKSHVYCLQAKHRKAGSSVNFNDLINMQQNLYLLKEFLIDLVSEIVTILLEHGCNVDSLCHDDKTPLHEACLNCNFDVAQVLLERGANAHHRTSENGFSLLHIAAQRNCPEIIQLLIDNGLTLSHDDFQWRHITPKLTPLFNQVGSPSRKKPNRPLSTFVNFVVLLLLNEPCSSKKAGSIPRDVCRELHNWPFFGR